MDSSITDLLLYIGLVLVMVAYWTFYIRYVRRIPGSEEWYDSAEPEGAESDGLLFIYPFGTLLMGAGGALGLVVSMGLPEPVDWVYRRVRDTASVAFCSALGRGHPQSKTCSKA